jgi:hypothetical protein
MTTAYTNYFQGGVGSVVQTVVTYSGTSTSGTFTTSFAEPSTSYRVSITPQFASSIILLNYYVPINMYWTGTKNNVSMIRAIRIVGGTTYTQLTSSGSGGSGNSTPVGMTGHAFRSLNGYDYNDHQAEKIQAIDAPNTTSTVTYGFQLWSENSNVPTIYVGASASNNGTWGMSADIVITAREIRQLGN